MRVSEEDYVRAMAAVRAILESDPLSVVAFTKEELESMDEELLADIDLDAFSDSGWDLQVSAGHTSAPPEGSTISKGVPMCGTQRITIRVPRRVLAAFRARAKSSGTRYQTLIVRTLQSTVSGWATPAPHL